MPMSFTDEMWAEIGPPYDATLALPFNREPAPGMLSPGRFTFYMIQDAHCLGAFARALATASPQASDSAAQVKRTGSAKDAITGKSQRNTSSTRPRLMTSRARTDDNILASGDH